ncbi:MAG: type I restriction endonuclease subunit R [Thaumarchaeota archaeon]|nr:type I restriction endonuclease subunit R [Nitrososphaerota archaeon]
MKKPISESDVEEYVLSVLQELGYETIRGDSEEYLPGGHLALREDYETVVLVDRLRDALRRINPGIPGPAVEDAIRQVLRSSSQHPIADNESFHKMLVDGVDVPIRTESGERYEKAWLFEFDDKKIRSNDFLAVNQFTIKGDDERRPDVILFVNGIPLAVFELKNLADEKTDIWSAYNQLQTYMKKIPDLFRYVEILTISDGMQARAGTMSSGMERFMEWKTIDGSRPDDGLSQTEILMCGMFERNRFLDIVRNFIVFEKDEKTTKKMAAYHQYWAANKALQSTANARGGTKKAGVVWHTQGSGKSLTMVFYAGKLVRDMDNPTIVVLTDRNDLDAQLFGTFGRCQDMLRQKPVQAEARRDLSDLLSVASGGIVFTTIQKFLPENRDQHPVLSERDNIVVIADEAHRSHYGFAAKIVDRNDAPQVAYGLAKYLKDALPNASFIGFTGTPIEQKDRSTPAVFGDYVDIYDVQQAVEDGSTVRIYYQNKFVPVDIRSTERPRIDKDFARVTEGSETDEREKVMREWSRMEKLVGAPDRIRRIAGDIIRHYEERSSVLEGKAMIVCMSRRICVELHDEIVRRRPDWYHKDDDKGLIKVVFTGSASDPEPWQEHVRNKQKRRAVGDRFKDPGGAHKIIIVRDMFLTGFDAPSLHTMYLDKWMDGHTLMQAIARVNRVYPGKEGGLVVDYMDVGREIRDAMSDYTRSGGRGKQTNVQDDAVSAMLEKYDVVRCMFHGFDYMEFFGLRPEKRVPFMSRAADHILGEPGRKERFLKEFSRLRGAFSIALPREEAMGIKDEVGFFEAIKAAVAKTTGSGGANREKFDAGIKQIISKAIVSDEIIDIIGNAGSPGAEVSVLSEAFLANIRKSPEKNLAREALRRILEEKIRTYSRRNIVKGRSFRDLLEDTIRRYNDKRISTGEVIDELVRIARQIREERDRGKALDLDEDELAFYDALGVSDSAVRVMGDSALASIAKELTDMIRRNVTIDWTQKASVQAAIRLEVKKILSKHGYPPVKTEKATSTVLSQAGVIAKNWAGS